MALLIRGGRIITMTQRGSMTGDILISGHRIMRVEEKIDSGDDTARNVLSADGMTILPGMIDPFISSGGYDPAWLQENMLASGVTSGLLMPDDGEDTCCQYISEEGVTRSAIHMIRTEDHDLRVLQQKMKEHASVGNRLLMQVSSARICLEVLDAAAEAGAALMLAGLQGCAKLVREIAAHGVTAVLGIQRGPGESPWRMAAALDEAGVPVSLSCCHPAAKLRLLPVCAALCVRDGMQRDRALRAITCNPAMALGLSDRGRIEAGFRADLTIFDGDPLLLATSRVMTISGGRIVNRKHRVDIGLEDMIRS